MEIAKKKIMLGKEEGWECACMAAVTGLLGRNAQTDIWVIKDVKGIASHHPEDQRWA